MVRFVCPLPLRPIDFLPTGEPPLGHSGRVRLGFLWYAGDFLAAGQIARAGHSNDVFCTLSLLICFAGDLASLVSLARLQRLSSTRNKLLGRRRKDQTCGSTPCCSSTSSSSAAAFNTPRYRTSPLPSPRWTTMDDTTGPKFATGSVYRGLGAGLGFLPIQTH